MTAWLKKKEPQAGGKGKLCRWDLKAHLPTNLSRETATHGPKGSFQGSQQLIWSLNIHWPKGHEERLQDNSKPKRRMVYLPFLVLPSFLPSFLPVLPSFLHSFLSFLPSFVFFYFVLSNLWFHKCLHWFLRKKLTQLAHTIEPLKQG